MSVHSEFSTRDGYLLVRLTGVIDREWVPHAPRHFAEYRTARELAGLPGVIVDIRDATIAVDVGDRYDLGVMYARSELASIRVAVLGREEHTTPDRFFQTVARNRGAQVRVFTSEEDAIVWVREARPHPVGAV